MKALIIPLFTINWPINNPGLILFGSQVRNWKVGETKLKLENSNQIFWLFPTTVENFQAHDQNSNYLCFHENVIHYMYLLMLCVFTDAETEDVDTGDVDSGNSTSHSPAEDKNSLMLTTSSYAATEGRLLLCFVYLILHFLMPNIRVCWLVGMIYHKGNQKTFDDFRKNIIHCHLYRIHW